MRYAGFVTDSNRGWRPTSSDARVHKPLAGFQSLVQGVKLPDELLTMSATLLRLASNACDKVFMHLVDVDQGQDVVEHRDKLALNHLDGDFNDETLPGDLVFC